MTKTSETEKYMVLFDESSALWTNNKGLNMNILQYVEHHCNELLNGKRRWLTLNDVCRELGVPERLEYLTIGWMHDRNDYDKTPRIQFEVTTCKEVNEFIITFIGCEDLSIYK